MEHQKKMATVYDVAEYVLNKFRSLTTMKLQKLVYYCQCWSLAWDEEPLFNEEFEAWANGPVCRELYNAHKGDFVVYEGKFSSYCTSYIFSDKQKETMESVINYYGNKDPQWLSELTHKEEPWREARQGVAQGEPSRNIIKKESMQEYYAGL